MKLNLCLNACDNHQPRLKKGSDTMPKFSPMKHGDRSGYSFQCPACGCAHMVLTDGKKSPNWTFNGDIENPTTNPSIRVRTEFNKIPKTCHFFIKNGMIEYCGDCTHDLAGQKIQLPEWE